MIVPNVLRFFLAFSLIGSLQPSAIREHSSDDRRLDRRGLLRSLLSGGNPSSGSAPTQTITQGLGNLLTPGPSSLGAAANTLFAFPPSTYNTANSLPGPPAASGPGDAPFTLPDAAYQSMLTCPNGYRAPRGCVLLIPPTAAAGKETWPSSPYYRGLLDHGYCVCWVDTPSKFTYDIQLAAEYVAWSIRFLFYQSGGPISVITYSQGGLSCQWALTFWPSIVSYVRIVIMLASPTHGSAEGDLVCVALKLTGGCSPALLQMRTTSQFIAALTAAVSSTALTTRVNMVSIYTTTDEYMVNIGSRPSSFLPGAFNIAVQEICGPLHFADHYMVPADMAIYSLAMSALLNGGRPDLSRFDRAACSLTASLGYNVGNIGNTLQYSTGGVIGNPKERLTMLLTNVPSLRTTAEPLLQQYVCNWGFASQCTQGFGQQPTTSILSDVPQTIGSLPTLLGNILGSPGRGR